MNFKISEHKISKVIKGYLQSFFIDGNFDWIKEIEIEVSNTKLSGWKDSYPVFKYNVTLNEDFVPTLYIADLAAKIDDVHNLIFPKTVDGPIAFYSIYLIYPDGRVRPLFQ